MTQEGIALLDCSRFAGFLPHRRLRPAGTALPASRDGSDLRFVSRNPEYAKLPSTSVISDFYPKVSEWRPADTLFSAVFHF